MSRLGLIGKPLASIRTRLILLALVAIAPLLVDRVRVLEADRVATIGKVKGELAGIASHVVEHQIQAISDLKVLLNAASRFHAVLKQRGGDCKEFLASAPAAPWSRTIGIADRQGRVICTNELALSGIDISDRGYFQMALNSGRFALGEYIITRPAQPPIIIGAVPSGPPGREPDGVVFMSAGLQWFGRLQKQNDTTVDSTLLVDGRGTVLALSEDASVLGTPQRDHPLIRSMLNGGTGSITTGGLDRVRRIYGFTQVPGTDAHFAVGAEEATALRGVNDKTARAYLQLVLFGCAILLGAWFGGEFLIVRPLRSFARVASRFGQGDLRARVASRGLATEFVPLATAFNEMGARLADREQELRNANSRLTILASIDAVSGLANRHGSASRLDYEWLRATDLQLPLGVLMIDVDHFKLFNDTYGHLEGDACLRRIGEVLAEIANQTSGFAARYGGEEFLFLLPDADPIRTSAIAEWIRREIEEIQVSHTASPLGHVTVSIGAASGVPRPGDMPRSLLEAADAGLYAAKRRGRNIVVEHGAVSALPAEAVA